MRWRLCPQKAGLPVKSGGRPLKAAGIARRDLGSTRAPSLSSPTRSAYQLVYDAFARRAYEGAVRIPGLHRQWCGPDRGIRGWRAVEVEHVFEVAGVRIPGRETREREALLQERQDGGMRADRV